MKNLRTAFFRISVALAALTVSLVSMPSLQGQGGAEHRGLVTGSTADVGPGNGVATDWTHRHVIFSDPGTADEASQNDAYDRWLKITGDPRYTMQQLKRKGAGSGRLAVHLPIREQEGFARGARISGGDEASVWPTTAEDFPGGELPRGITRAPERPPSPSSPLKHVFPQAGFHPKVTRTTNLFQKDWSETVGNNGTTGLGNFPATFTRTSASCVDDFAV